MRASEPVGGIDPVHATCCQLTFCLTPPNTLLQTIHVSVLPLPHLTMQTSRCARGFKLCMLVNLKQQVACQSLVKQVPKLTKAARSYVFMTHAVCVPRSTIIVGCKAVFAHKAMHNALCRKTIQTLSATLIWPALGASSAACLGLAQGQRRAERSAQHACTCAVRLPRAARQRQAAGQVAHRPPGALRLSQQKGPPALHPCAVPQRAHRGRRAARAARHGPAADAQRPAGELRPPGLRACRHPGRPPHPPLTAGAAPPGAPRLHAHAHRWPFISAHACSTPAARLHLPTIIIHAGMLAG